MPIGPPSQRAIPAATYSLVSTIVADLDDGHSSFLTPSQVAADDLEEGQRQPMDRVQLIDQIAIVEVPGIRAGPETLAGQEYIETLRRGLAEVADTACGIVVDVRGNTGGNLLTMLAGITPVLGPGSAVSYQLRDGTMTEFVVGEDGFVTVPDGPDSAGRPQLPAFEDLGVPVAVLQGPGTASSGEGIVMSFRGRPRSRSFGLPTLGVPTAREFIPLSDGSALLLTTGVGVDFGGELHDDQIAPDETVSGYDATEEAASSWLRSQSGCA